MGFMTNFGTEILWIIRHLYDNHYATRRKIMKPSCIIDYNKNTKPVETYDMILFHWKYSKNYGRSYSSISWNLNVCWISRFQIGIDKAILKKQEQTTHYENSDRRNKIIKITEMCGLFKENQRESSCEYASCVPALCV